MSAQLARPEQGAFAVIVVSTSCKRQRLDGSWIHSMGQSKSEKPLPAAWNHFKNSDSSHIKMYWGVIFY